MIDLLAISPASFTAVNRSIYRELARRGWSVEIVIPTRHVMSDVAREHEPARPGDPPIHPLAPTRGNPRLHGFAGLQTLLSARRPRLVLIDNDPNSRLALEVGLWCRAHGARLVCQSNENLTRRWLASARRGGARGLAGALLTSVFNLGARRLVDHVFVISRDGQRVLTEQGFGSVTRIPLGFDAELFRPDEALRDEARARLGLVDPTVAYFGRLAEQKGVHLLIEALGRLRHLRFQLLLDRFSAYRSDYERRIDDLIVDHGVADRVVRFDAKHDEMPRYMNAADLVALPSISTPSWREQYGRVAPEAMACGRTVIVSDSGALPELVGDGGVIVPEGDVAALTDAIARLLADPARREALGRVAAARAHAELDLRRQADLMDEVLRALVEGARVR
ncbi:MAG: glycosyltransferase family 4 protein [Deltaproteobacteria bacterium]|nr:glycosyltransferase family 4 protein [Deltaproteobacteria bacterium]